LLSLFKHFEKLQPWLQQQGFELCLVRCKIWVWSGFFLRLSYRWLNLNRSCHQKRSLI